MLLAALEETPICLHQTWKVGGMEHGVGSMPKGLVGAGLSWESQMGFWDEVHRNIRSKKVRVEC